MKREKVKPKLVLSEADYLQVAGYLQGPPAGITAQALEEEISRAEVRKAADLPRGTVRLNARVLFRDLNSGLTREVTIVRPELANVERGLVSFFAPVGAALLGLSAGQQIDWQMPNGQIRSFRVLRVENQRIGAGPPIAA